MTYVIKHNRSEKKGVKKKKKDWYKKKLKIPESQYLKCPEDKTKSKIRQTFENEKTLEKYCAKIYEIDPYFHEHHEKKVMKMDIISYCPELMFVFFNMI